MKILTMIYSVIFLIFLAIATTSCVIFFSPAFLLPTYMRYNATELAVNFLSIFMNNILLMTKIKIIGKKNVVNRKRTSLYICNHQSWVDIPIFMSNSRAPVISKIEIKSVPLLGAIASLIGTIFFDREKSSSRIALIKECSVVFKKGHSICLFPEGTRSIDGNLQEPNMALIKLCFKQNISVVPAAIHGSIDVMRKHVHYFSPFKKIVLKYSQPVLPQDYNNADEFAAACWEKVGITHEEIKRDFFSKS